MTDTPTNNPTSDKHEGLARKQLISQIALNCFDLGGADWRCLDGFQRLVRETGTTDFRLHASGIGTENKPRATREIEGDRDGGLTTG